MFGVLIARHWEVIQVWFPHDTVVEVIEIDRRKEFGAIGRSSTALDFRQARHAGRSIAGTRVAALAGVVGGIKGRLSGKKEGGGWVPTQARVRIAEERPE